MTSASPDGDRDQLAEFLSRYLVNGQPISGPAARGAADRIAETRLPAYELATRGYRHLTVVHSDPETAEDEAAMCQLPGWGNRHPGAIRSTIGTNDTAAFLLAPPHADDHLAAIEAVAQGFDPGWWTIRRATR
ncbi:hypothetical protein ACX27O_09695 [Micromonospora sp. SD19]